MQKKRGEFRSAERIHARYALERRLATRLRQAPQAERSSVYSEVYAELFRSLPDHSQHTAARDKGGIGVELEYTFPLLHSNAALLEIGCGDAELSFASARLVRQLRRMMDLNVAGSK